MDMCPFMEHHASRQKGSKGVGAVEESGGKEVSTANMEKSDNYLQKTGCPYQTYAMGHC